MRTLKWSLMGTVAGLGLAMTAAYASDALKRTAAPVEYVRVCSSHGAGFFYVPGTDTCLKIGGRVRFSYQYMSSRQRGPSITGVNAANSLVNRDNSGFQSLIFLNLDSRTSTNYGTLRTFIRLLAAYNSGGYLTSGTAQRFGTAYPALGQDTFGRAQSLIYLDKAFIQFAGFTAGRAGSFFDFYAHDLEHFAATSGSDVPSTNLLAYTATFGGGWSATISVEDPIARRQPTYSNLAFGSTGVGTPFSLLGDQVAGLTTVGGTFVQSVPYTASDGTLRFANYDVSQRSLVPDVVGVVRYDAPWGAAQVSAAMHEIRGGALVNTIGTATSSLTGLVAPTGSASQGIANVPVGLPGRLRAELGYAIQGGLKLNLPQLAAGDVLWLQAAYSEGALAYAGHPARFGGSEALAAPYSGRFTVSTVDSFIGRDGKQKLTEAWSVTAAFLHYWNPELRSAIFGSYAEVNFGKGARSFNSPGNLVVGSLPGFGGSSGRNSLSYNTVLRDYSVSVVGANLIWSPIKDLDIGLEGVYTRVDLKNGRAADLSYGSALLPSATGPGTAINGVPVKTAKFDDVWSLRMRVQRDF